MLRRTTERSLITDAEYASPVLSGKDASGNIGCLHRHAHYLPTSDGTDSRYITHVTIFARDGLSEAEVAAISAIRTTKLGNVDDLQVQLVGPGRPEDFTNPARHLHLGHRCDADGGQRDGRGGRGAVRDEKAVMPFRSGGG